MPSEEARYLLTALRSHFGTTDRPLACPSRGGSAWDAVAGLASEHRVLPLLVQALKRLGAIDTSDPSVSVLVDSATRNAVRNSFLWDALYELLGGLNSEGVETLVFKGPLLARDVYGDLGLRRFMDLDILVRPERVASSARILRELGYRPWFELNPRQEEALMHFRGVHTYTRSDGTVQVDLHSRLDVSPFAMVPTRDLWERSRTVFVEDRGCRSFSPEDELLYLCGHGCHHQWRRLAHVVDVGAVLARHGAQIDWDAVLGRARRARRVRSLGVALSLARNVLGVRSTPQDGSAFSVEGETVAALARGFEQLLLSGAQEADRERARLTQATLERQVDRFRRRVVLPALTPTGLECRMFTVPEPLFCLYRVVRVVRLMAKRIPGREAESHQGSRGVAVPVLADEDDACETRTLDGETFAVLSAELIAESGGLRFRAQGRSMAPFVRDGDVLTIEKIPPADLRVGDIALFRSRGGSVLAHRVCRSVGGSDRARWTTRGDALFVQDPSFGPDSLLGRVATVERDGSTRRLDGGLGRLAGQFWLLTYQPRRLLCRIRTRLHAVLRRRPCP